LFKINLSLPFHLSLLVLLAQSARIYSRSSFGAADVLAHKRRTTAAKADRLWEAEEDFSVL